MRASLRARILNRFGANRILKVLAVTLALMASTPALSAGPRIASINPCVDAILTRVADADQIVGISHYSQDPRSTSISMDVATSGTAEEIVVLQPDILMSGPHASPATMLALERMKIRVMKYPVPESVEQSLEQVRSVAAAVGHPDRGEQLALQIDNAVARARSNDDRSITALIWQDGGMVPGTGTLSDQLLQLAGFSNMSAEYGLKKWDVLPIEYLLGNPPRLVLSISRSDAAGDRMLGHPAIGKLSKDVTFRSYPFQLLSCAGPTIIDAVTRLAEIRRELVPR
jgi:iron complex transport system substrate-binding protein